jgi:hypothetical protein
MSQRIIQHGEAASSAGNKPRRSLAEVCHTIKHHAIEIVSTAIFLYVLFKVVAGEFGD